MVQTTASQPSALGGVSTCGRTDRPASGTPRRPPIKRVRHAKGSTHQWVAGLSDRRQKDDVKLTHSRLQDRRAVHHCACELVASEGRGGAAR